VSQHTLDLKNRTTKYPQKLGQYTPDSFGKRSNLPTRSSELSGLRPGHTKLRVVRKTDPSLLINLLDWLWDLVLLPFRLIGFLLFSPVLLVRFLFLQLSLLFKPSCSDLPRVSSHPTRSLETEHFSGSKYSLDLRKNQGRGVLDFRPIPLQAVFMEQPQHNVQDIKNLSAKQRLPALESPSERGSSRQSNGAGRYGFFKTKQFSSGLVLAAAIFLVVANMFYQTTLRIYRQVFAEATTGQEYLLLAENYIRAQDFPAAQDAFYKASQSFQIALDEMAKTKPAGVIPGVNTKLDIGELMISTGLMVSRAGYEMSIGLEPIFDIFSLEDSAQMTEDSMIADYTAQVMTVMMFARPQLRKSLAEINEARSLLARVDPGQVGSEYQDQLEQVVKQLDSLGEILDRVYSLSMILPDLLGNNGARHYLLVFQNNAELRPTGGFIGSYGVFSFDNGKLDQFFTDNVYNPDGQILVKGLCQLPPLPLQRLSLCWGMRDANWSPNFPTSAMDIIELYRQASERRVHGVIAITPEVLKDLLEITGPIYLSKWEEVVDSENAIDLIQYKVTLEQADTANPKTFLIDLSYELFDRVFALEKSSWTKLFNILDGALEKKDIQIFILDREQQRLIEKQGWAGSLLPNSHDYLLINNANVNGTKAHSFIEQKYQLTTNILQSGEVENTLQISYEHTGNWDWPSGVVESYQRVYLPLGAQLISSSAEQEGKRGITEVYEEVGKTVFADYIKIFPSSTLHITYRYSLPFTVAPFEERLAKYELVYQSQPGVYGIPLEHTIIFDPFEIMPLQATPGVELLDRGTIKSHLGKDKDVAYEIVFRRFSVLD